MRRNRYLKLLATGAGAALLSLGLTPVAASSANISHSYHTDTNITDGSLVSLDPQRSDYVQAANSSNGARLLGLAVATKDSLIAIDSTSTTLQVATSGDAKALVSTLGGDIKVGDQVGVSPLSGVGIKALPGSRVVGLAKTDFNSSTPGNTTEQVTDKNGHNTSVHVGYINVSVAVGTNATVLNSATLNGLQRFAYSLTGHTVSTFRVAISLVVAIVAMLSLITLIYASIYSSIISVGRNPLARFAVFHTLRSVLGLAVLTATVSSLTIFLLLR